MSSPAPGKVSFTLLPPDSPPQHLGAAVVHLAGVTTAGVRSQGYWPRERFLCPWCGRPWADVCYDPAPPDVPVAGREWAAPWRFITRPCTVHGDGRVADNIPPSVMPDPLAQYLATVFLTLYSQGRIHVNSTTPRL